MLIKYDKLIKKLVFEILKNCPFIKGGKQSEYNIKISLKK